MQILQSKNLFEHTIPSVNCFTLLFSSFTKIKLEIHSMNHLQIGNFLWRDIFFCTYNGEVRWIWNRTEFTWNCITFTKFLWCPRPRYFYICYFSNFSHELDKHNQLWKQRNELTELVRDETKFELRSLVLKWLYFPLHMRVINSDCILEASGSF